ncbi:MAG: hypothetical protein ACO3C1_11595 [Ilumatobacteraceae bacterium]
MISSRRVVLASGALVLGLLVTSCGDAPIRTASGLPTISLGAGNAAGGEMAAATADSRMSMMPWGDVTYEFAGDLPDLGTAAPAYRFAAGVAPDAATVAALAAALGVDGDMVQVPQEQGGGWMVGPADYSGPTITIARDGLLSWWYGNPSAGVSYPGCAVPDVAPSSGSGDDAAASGTAVPVPADEPAVTTEPCAEPTPPAGVPTADEAKALATALLDAAGVDTGALDWDVYADDWSASVTGYALVDGQRGPLAWNVGFGADGVVQWASGTLATAEEVGDYPIVSAADGLARLNDDTRQWQWYGSGVMYAARDAVSISASGTATAPVAGVAVDAGDATSGTVVVTDGTMVGEVTVGSSGTVSVGGGATGSGVIVGTVVPDSAPMVIATAPIDTAVPEPVTVTLTSVHLGSTMVWDADGTVWLLPAYVFSGTDTGDVTVIAVDEHYLDIPEAPMPEPMPAASDPASIGTVPPEGVLVDPMPEAVDPAAAAVLVGLGEDEAAKVADGNGWTVRPVRIDGVDQAATMDYSPTRINVAVEGGIVTEVVSVG